MYKELDIESWNRKDHFLFFKDFEEPFFGITVDIDCTKSFDYCRKNDSSFFLYYIHAALTAANRIDNFRYRLIDDRVVVYDKINASPTVGRDDGTFGFSYMDFYPDFIDFAAAGKKEIERVKNSTGLEPAVAGENVIHFSSLPWLRFTSLSHARHFKMGDSCPKISFGKMIDTQGVKTMPVSIHAHHALVDGVHVGQLVEIMESLL